MEKSKKDLLQEAEFYLANQQEYIEQLKGEVDYEEKEELHKRVEELKQQGYTEAHIAEELDMPVSSFRLVQVTQLATGKTALIPESELREEPKWVDRLDREEEAMRAKKES